MIGGALAGRPARLVALAGVAVGVPIFDLLGRTPGFFAAQGLGGAATAVLIGGVWLLPGALALAGAEVAGFGSRARRALAYRLAYGLALTSVLLVPLRTVSWPAPVVLTLAALAGLMIGWHYRRLPVVHPLAVLVWLAAPVLLLLGSRSMADADVPPATAIGRPMPVVLVVFDELPTASLLGPDGAIDARLFPNFARLAASATWYPAAITPAPRTQPALVALLTGRRPASEAPAATAEAHPRNLFRLLAASHDVISREARTRLGPADADGSLARSSWRALAGDLGVVYLHLLAPRRLAARLPDVTTRWGDFGGAVDKAANARAFLAGLERKDRPELIFLHSELPHHPWIYLPSGRRYDPGLELFADGLVGGVGPASARWTDDPWTVVQAYQRHLLQAAFVDRLLGELLDRLAAIGLLDEALLVITADHGVSFVPGAPMRAVGTDNGADILGVPLFVKLPGQRAGRVDDRAASLIDVLPTLVEAQQIRVDWSFDGRSLLAPVAGGSEADPLAAWRRRTTAVKHRLFGARAGVAGLYAIGPRHEVLLGQPAAPRLGTGVGELTAELDGAARFADVDLAAATLPLRIGGRVRGPGAGQGLPLALAVEGRVVALGQSRRDAGFVGRFSFLLPEEALGPGHNQLELFRVDGAAGEPTLQPIAVDPLIAYRLDEDRGHGALEASDGSELTLDPGRFVGQVSERVFRRRGFRVELIGWACDSDSGAPADAIAVFVDGAMAHLGKANLERPELARYAMPGRERCGFVFYLPREAVAGDVRVFALGAGAATELRVTRDRRPRDDDAF